MKTNITLQLQLFTGFYGSYYDDSIENNIQADLEHIGKTYEEVDINTNYTELAKDIFDFAKYEYFSEFNFLSELEFDSLESPKYYNYTNDKIYFNCNIDKEAFKTWLIELVSEGADLFDNIANEIEDVHTSNSGFISFHSNSYKDWIKDLLELDLENEKTLYKLSFILSEYVKSEQLFEDGSFDFEWEYLSNVNYSGIYDCYELILPSKQ